MDLPSVLFFVGCIIWIIPIIFNFKTASSNFDSTILQNFGYGFFAYFLYTLECGFKIIFSEDNSDISLYIFFLFAIFNLYTSAFLIYSWIKYDDFLQTFNKFNQLFLIMSWVITTTIIIMLISNDTLRNLTFIKGMQLIFIIEILVFYIIVKKYFNHILEVHYYNANNILHRKSCVYLELLASSCWITALGINSVQNYWYLFKHFSTTGIAGSAFVCNLIIACEEIFFKFKLAKSKRKILDGRYSRDKFINQEEEKTSHVSAESELSGLQNSIIHLAGCSSPPPLKLGKNIKYIWGYDHPELEGFWSRMYDYAIKHSDDDDFRGRHMAFMESPCFIPGDEYFRV